MDISSVIASTKAFFKGVPKLEEHATSIIGPSAKELGLFFGEKVRILRFKSSLKTFSRAQEMLEEAGLKARPVDLKLLVPLLEHCSVEDESSDLIEKWAGLLATAAATGIEDYSFPHILNELSPREVRLLDNLYDSTVRQIKAEDRLTTGFAKEILSKLLHISGEEFNVVADNLFRLFLVQPAASSGVLLGKDPVAVRTYDIICMTPLGMKFVRTCRGPVERQISGALMAPEDAPEQDNVGRLG